MIDACALKCLIMNCQFGPSYLLRRVTSCVKTIKAKFDGNYNFEKKNDCLETWRLVSKSRDSSESRTVNDDQLNLLSLKHLEVVLLLILRYFFHG